MHSKNRGIRYLIPVVGFIVGMFLLVGAPPKASASAPPSFYAQGTGFSYMSEYEWDRIQATGVGMVRLKIEWNRVHGGVGNAGSPGAHCTSGTSVPVNSPDYDWSELDQAFRYATERGIRILGLLEGGNGCAAGVDQFPVPGTNAFDRWIDFAGAVVNRYGINGAFWGTMPIGYKPLPVPAWEVWNEPNIPGYNPGGSSIQFAEYGQLLYAASQRIQAQQPGQWGNYSILIGGLYPNTGIGCNTNEKAVHCYLRRLYNNYPGDPTQVKQAWTALSYHPYALTGDGGDAYQKVVDARADLDSQSHGNRSIWVTEAGWPVNEPDQGFTSGVTEAQQAAYIQELFTKLSNNRASADLNISLATTYHTIDNPPTPGVPQHWAAQCGLVDDVGNTKRPAWHTLRTLTGGPNGSRPLITTSPSVDRNPTNASSIIAFINEGNRISYWADTSPHGWLSRDLAGPAAAGTDPAVARDPGSGRTTIAFRRPDGRIGVLHRADGGATTQWSEVTLGTVDSSAAGSSPALVRTGSVSGGDYLNTLVDRRADGKVRFWVNSTGNTWTSPVVVHDSVTGSPGLVAADSDLALTRGGPNDIIQMAYRNTDGQIGTIMHSPFGWTGQTIGTVNSVASGSSPDISRDWDTGEVMIPYRRAGDDQLSAWALLPGAWSYIPNYSGVPLTNNTNPTIALDQDHGISWITATRSSGEIALWPRNANSTWQPSQNLGGKVGIFSDPVASASHLTGGTEDPIIAYFDQTNTAADLRVGTRRNWPSPWAELIWRSR